MIKVCKDLRASSKVVSSQVFIICGASHDVGMEVKANSSISSRVAVWLGTLSICRILLLAIEAMVGKDGGNLCCWLQLGSREAELQLQLYSTVFSRHHFFSCFVQSNCRILGSCGGHALPTRRMLPADGICSPPSRDAMLEALLLRCGVLPPQYPKWLRPQRCCD